MAPFGLMFVPGPSHSIINTVNPVMVKIFRGKQLQDVKAMFQILKLWLILDEGQFCKIDGAFALYTTINRFRY